MTQPKSEMKLSTFTFRVRGHGQDIPAVTLQAQTEDKAFKAALKECKHFTLPGWQLYCVETGSSQNAAEFFDPSETTKSGAPSRKRL